MTRRSSDPPQDAQGAPPGTAHFAWELPFPDAAARRAAWRHMLFRDEGLIRLAYPNLHRVSARAWRSGQPNPRQLGAFAGRGGRTVVSVRNGRNFGSLPLEIESCHRLGLDFHILAFRSRRLAGPEQILAFDALLKRIEYPLLIHCKSGADRTGFAAALYLMLAEGRPAAEARWQLSLRYGHIKSGPAGVLDAFFDAYERDTRGDVALADWVRTGYDPTVIEAAFRPRAPGRFLVNRVLGRE